MKGVGSRQSKGIEGWIWILDSHCSIVMSSIIPQLLQRLRFRVFPFVPQLQKKKSQSRSSSPLKNYLCQDRIISSWKEDASNVLFDFLPLKIKKKSNLIHLKK